MATKRSKPLSKLSRTRSGCLTCRDRHMKCDEQQPVCKNCIKSKRKCYRGIRLNFTQYNIFRPESELPVCSSYRFLDQSLTIASLYRNGTESYFPYLKLHNPKDLEESDLKYQEDLYASSTSSSYLPVGQVEIPKRNEGTDLLGFNRWQPISERNSILGQGILKSLVDREKRIQKDMTADVTNDVTTKFLKLVEIEEYYWLLDLFNELGVWKSIVPNYCINTLNDGDEFLTKCLLNCSRNSDYDLNGIIQEQSSLLESFKFQDVTPENEKKFKNLLISVVLILLNFNIKISGSLITLTDFHKSLLNDQAKIFDILMKKFTLNGWKMAKSAVLFSSIQSVVILKYFITKQFESKGLLNGIKEGWINQTQQLLNNSNHDISILSDFITFTLFELSHLQDSFLTLDFPQVDGVNSLEPDSNYVSDSLKLRRVMWQLIRCNFAVEHPEKDTFRLSLDEEYENLKAEMSNSIDSDHSWVTFTNERLVAANILRDMVMKIIKNNDRELVATANREIHHIFFAIKDSSQHPNGKSHWENNFNWTVKIIR